MKKLFELYFVINVFEAVVNCYFDVYNESTDVFVFLLDVKIKE